MLKPQLFIYIFIEASFALSEPTNSSRAVKEKSSLEREAGPVMLPPKLVSAPGPGVNSTATGGTQFVQERQQKGFQMTIKRSRKHPVSLRKPASRINSRTTPLASRPRVNLSEDIAQSEQHLETAGKKMRPVDMGKLKKKKPGGGQLVISSPSETVEVPDGLDWEHNRKDQEDKAQQLKGDKDPAIPTKIEDY